MTEVTAAVCPFLVALDGAWRAAVPAREHRCGATDPPGRLPLDRQQSLCLAAAHLSCPLFEAAAGLTVGSHLQEAARAAAELDPRAVPASEGEAWRSAGGEATEPPPFVRSNRPVPRTTPVILDRARPSLEVHVPQLRLPANPFGRSRPAAEDPGRSAAGLPQTRLEALRAARSAARAQGEGSAPTDAEPPTPSRVLPGAGLADGPSRLFAPGASRTAPRADDLSGLARPAAPTTRPPSPAVGITGAQRMASGTGSAYQRPARVDTSAEDARAAEAGSTTSAARADRSSVSAAPPRTPPGGAPASGGGRRFAPPGGPGRFRTLGRIGGSGGATGTVRSLLAGRQVQIALAGLMGIALLVVLVVRFSGGEQAGVAGSSSSPRPSSSLTAGASPVASGPSPSAARPSTAGGSAAPATSAPSASPAESAGATPAPSKSPARTYRVKAGDTLSAIAARFKTTVAVLMRLNNIKDPRALRVGQILKLP